MTPQSATLQSATVDPSEIDKFSRVATTWWDEGGSFGPLHRLNPVRLGYIRAQAIAHFGLDIESIRLFSGLTVLDIGCGGGLVAEPMARLGAKVTAIDADPVAIETADAHAEQSGLQIDYRVGTIDSLDQTFDVVLALEIIEHVADIRLFIEQINQVLKPGGLLILSTLNRTPRSFLLGIVAAEYILGWVPRGTHAWNRFIRPSELARDLRQGRLRISNLAGIVYKPISGSFTIDPGDLSVNYLATAVRSDVIDASQG